MNKDATIQMTRVSMTGNPDEMQVELLLDEGTKAFRVAMTMENFARAIVGEFKVPCHITRRNDQ